MPGGAGWYRCALPARFLAAHGHETLHTHTVGQIGTGEMCPLRPEPGQHELDLSGWDVIVLQRWMNAAAPDVIARARACGQVVINDVDDWYQGLAQSNDAFRSTDPRRNATANREHYRRAILASSGLTVSTDYLAERLSKSFRRPIVVVRNAIDLARWRWMDTSTEQPTIGWVGATPWRSGDLETLRGIMRPFLKRHGLRFVHHGHYPGAEPAWRQLGLYDTATDARTGFDLLQDRRTGESRWVRGATDWGEPELDLVGDTWGMAPITEYPSLFRGIDIGLVPLADVPFNRAKSWIKSLEYAASGIASVATDLPEQRLGAMSLLARRPRDWTSRLERLLDPTERASTAAAAYQRARQLDIAERWADWESAITTIAGASAPLLATPPTIGTHERSDASAEPGRTGPAGVAAV